jgi:glycosyltransferase involved in cell wall biosynthesis
MCDITIIICTRNRADDLRETLDAIGRCDVRAGRKVEMLVVDNGSTDHTKAVIESAVMPSINVKYLYQPKAGVSWARNMATAAAKGEAILCTDDDGRPCRDWIVGMTEPLLNGDADAIAGGITLAPHLERPWMTPSYRGRLATTAEMRPDDPGCMVGGNMAFHRRVLTRVPSFDIELGPAGLGSYDETLFSWQIIQAGFRLKSAFDANVEHHPQVSRLSRQAFISLTEAYGRSLAYIDHQWRHRHQRWIPARRLVRAAKLQAARLAKPNEIAWDDHAPIWELGHLQTLAYFKQFEIERRRPRNYERFGLEKLPPSNRS